jgi:CRP/FNR family transcriptional regulator
MKATTQNVFVLSHARQESASTCMACSKKSVCPAASHGAGSAPEQIVIRAGKPAYEANDKFGGVYIVRSGFFKSYSINADGEMQVTGFHMPGEFFGMDGIETGEYRDHVEALDTSSVCRIPLEVLTRAGSTSRRTSNGETTLNTEGGAEPESMMMALVKLMSRTISRDRNMLFSLGKMSARRRFSTFLLDISERMGQSGYSGKEFKLCMSRTDIANYLCLALETVSRLFTQLQVEGIIKVDRRDVQILNIEALSIDEPEVKKFRKAG